MFNHYYIHKKFLWMWVKWSYHNNIKWINLAVGAKNTCSLLKNGKYDWSRGETGSYFYITDKERYGYKCDTEVIYVDSVEEFEHRFIERLI